jgi:Fur family ferric uptake transcriptional regulator
MDSPSKERPSLVEEFSAKGLRLTNQRRVLLEVIQEATEHLDATSLLRLAKERDSSVNRATVYRTLELLKKLRLVDELDLMHLNGEKHYYEVRSEKDHIHLACFRCGKIEEFGSPLFESLKQEIGRACGFHINLVRMEVGGSCSDCAKHAD